MYDENGLVSHANSSSAASIIPDTSTNSIAAASSSSQIISSTIVAGSATNGQIVSNLSDSNSPTASAVSDCCSYDSSSGDLRLLNNSLYVYPNSLLPFLNNNTNHLISSQRKAAQIQNSAATVLQAQSRQKIDQSNMALINTSMMNVKDSRWLQVEVCREFQRGQCSRNEQECKFAHPPPNVEVQNGRVTACYDHLKGRCTRDNPKCKFLHAPQHLKDQLLLNGRNNLMLKNYMTQLNTQTASILPPSAAAATAAAAMAASSQFTNFPFATAVPGTGAALMPGAIGTYSPYAYALNTAVYPGLMSAASQDALGTYGGILPTGAATSPVSMAAAAAVQQAQKAAIVRVDRVEALQSTPVNKRAALEKGGIPVFQPMTPVSAAAVNALQYPQFAAAFPGFQTSYVPVTFTAANTATHAPAPASAAAAALPGGGGGGAVMAAALQQQQLQQLQALVQQQQSIQQQQQNAAAAAASLVAVPRIPNNVASVAYFDESGQLLDTLPVCRDFKQSRCERPNCRYVHLLEDYVEMNNEGKVTVCRDFAKGKCSRVMCKYYHVPLLSPIAASTMTPNAAVLPTAAALLASSTSPFSSYLSPSSSTSPPWSLQSSVWLQRLQQQSLFNSPMSQPDYLTSAALLSPSNAASTFDQSAFFLQQQQALLAAQQSALLNSTVIQAKPMINNRNGTATDETPGSTGSTTAVTTSASSQDRQTSPTGGRRS